MDDFIRFLYTRINVYIHKQTAITVLIRVSKNNTSILPRIEKIFNIYIFVPIARDIANNYRRKQKI